MSRPMRTIATLTMLVAACGSTADTPASDTTAGDEQVRSPVETLVDLGFEALAMQSRLERGTYDQEEPWPPMQRRAHERDADGARLLEQLANVADRLDAPRCRFSASLLVEAPKPSASEARPEGPPELYPMTTYTPTRAADAEALVLNMLLGLETPESQCAVARLRVARSWQAVLAEVERRDGVAAAVADDAARRAQVERLRAIEEEYAATSGTDDPDSTRVALQREAVAILETWSPEPARLEALRSHDYTQPVTPEADRDRGTPYRELQALLQWAIRGAIREAMPPVRNESQGARALRGFLEALRHDPDDAIGRLRALPDDLPREHGLRDPSEGSMRQPAYLARICGTDEPASAPTPGESQGGDGEGLDDVEAEMLAAEEEMEGYFAPSTYYCTAEYDGRALGLLASRFDETNRDDIPEDEPGPPPSGQLTLHLLELGCEAGNARSCGLLGWHLDEGPETSRDPDRARELLTRGCANGEDYEDEVTGPACTRLGALLSSGRGGSPDTSAAWTAYERACDARYAPGCDGLVELVRAGQAPLPAAELDDALEDWCRLGAAQACIEGGRRRLADARTDEEIQPALDAFVAACNVHQLRDGCELLVRYALHRERYHPAVAIFGESLCYRDGEEAWCGIAAYVSESDQRERTAARGCEAGSPDGCAAAAVIAGARALNATLRRTCDEGSSLGCFELARRTQRRDPAGARELYGRSCGDDDDLALGCVELAALLESRRGGAVDTAAAQTARARACELVRHPDACR